jgi:glutamine synthetase
MDRETRGKRASADAEEVLERCESESVRFMRLTFTDIDGIIKNVEVPRSQFGKALEGQIMFDGSSIEGFTRIEESDMLLRPDLETFMVYPWKTHHGRVGRLVCDILNPDGSPFAGCPRLTLKRVVERAREMGYVMMAGPEAEFFLFLLGPDDRPNHLTHDVGGYFDLTPVDKGEDARRDIVEALESMGFEVEAAHHEVAPGQHEIDFRYADAVTTADNVITFRFVVKKVAREHGLHATFMPKPIFGVNGSGMHTHQSLFDAAGRNTFHDPAAADGLSRVARSYIAGILEHAPAFVAVTNPLVNSYKRLVPGYEAPVNVAWSEKNRSPLVRVPERRGIGTRCEVRVPDPSCNPYLALAVMLASGLDGVSRGLDCGKPVNRNIFEMTEGEKKELGVRQLPANLSEALDNLERDTVLAEILGPHILENLLRNKREEWHRYISAVHPWEHEQYLGAY